MKKMKNHHRHEEGLPIDFYVHLSEIRHWNPIFKACFTFLVLILCITLDNPFVTVAVIMACIYITVIKGKLPMHVYLSVLTIPLLFILLGMIPLLLEFSVCPQGKYKLFLGLFYIYTTDEKLKTTGFLILKILGAVSSMQMIILSTPSHELIYVLHRLRVPKLITELMSIMYRFIFILFDIYASMKNSAEARLGYCDFKTSCCTFGNIAGNIFIISLKKANTYYDAMEARCYDGDIMFLTEEKKMKAMQIIPAAVFIILLIVLKALSG